MSTEQSEILLLIRSMERRQCCHQKSILSQQWWHHFNAEDQVEARELDSDLLEERCNTALANVRKYQAPLKQYYNKSMVPRELSVENLVLKDIRTRDKHKFSSA
jgi:hypothetical protein